MDEERTTPVTLPAILHPGETVAEYLDFHGWSQRDLSRRTGITPKTISEICNAKAPITPNTALAFERVFQRPAHFWLNLQRQFDEAEARQGEFARLAGWSDWARRFPIKEMRALRFSVPVARSDVDALLGFLGVSSPDSWNAVWRASNVAYRQTRNFKKSVEAVAAWVRETELVAAEIELAEFDEPRLRSLIEKLRSLTREPVDKAIGRAQELCASAGLAVVIVPALRNTGISGCARWLPDRKALIGLSLRYKTDDQLWFTFFHELGHILLHRRKRSFVLDNAAEDLSDRVVDPEMQAYESEANRFSGETLIPPRHLSDFIKQNRFTSDSIHDFAESVGIGPGIVVGRLQFEDILAPHQGNSLKQKVDWRFVEEDAEGEEVR
jgi:addiction module HigA family antidote